MEKRKKEQEDKREKENEGRRKRPLKLKTWQDDYKSLSGHHFSCRNSLPWMESVCGASQCLQCLPGIHVTVTLQDTERHLVRGFVVCAREWESMV